MTHCHRHAPALVAHPSDRRCPLCVSEESSSLARTEARLERRKVKRLEFAFRAEFALRAEFHLRAEGRPVPQLEVA